MPIRKQVRSILKRLGEYGPNGPSDPRAFVRENLRLLLGASPSDIEELLPVLIQHGEIAALDFMQEVYLSLARTSPGRALLMALHPDILTTSTRAEGKRGGKSHAAVAKMIQRTEAHLAHV